MRERVVHSLDDFTEVCEKELGRRSRWIFRGQSNAEWDLQTTFERSISPFIDMANACDLELVMLREFRRHYHRYTTDAPDYENTLEWLSVMQHHGTPTRLLDWTFSEYVALFFAALGALPHSHDYAIFALNQKLLWDQLLCSLRNSGHNDTADRLASKDKDPAAHNYLLTQCRETVVAPLNPMRLSERLSVQQGTFLVPLNPTLSFRENLDNTLHSIGQDCDKDYNEVR